MFFELSEPNGRELVGIGRFRRSKGVPRRQTENRRGWIEAAMVDQRLAQKSCRFLSFVWFDHVDLV